VHFSVCKELRYICNISNIQTISLFLVHAHYIHSRLCSCLMALWHYINFVLLFYVALTWSNSMSKITSSAEIMHFRAFLIFFFNCDRTVTFHKFQCNPIGHCANCALFKCESNKQTMVNSQGYGS